MAHRVQRAEAGVSRQGPSPRWYAGVNEPALYFPPGVYVYKGKGLECADAQLWHIKGDGPNQARIELADEVYFLTCGRDRVHHLRGPLVRRREGRLSQHLDEEHGRRTAHLPRLQLRGLLGVRDRQQRRRLAVSLRRRLHLLRAGEVAGHRHRLGRVLRRRASHALRLRAEPVSHQARRPHGREHADRPAQQLHLLRRHEEGSRHLAGAQQRPE